MDDALRDIHKLMGMLFVDVSLAFALTLATSFTHVVSVRTLCAYVFFCCHRIFIRY